MLFRRLCETARETGLPPELTQPEKDMLDRFGSRKRLLETMGIPSLKGSELRHMTRYWEEERANGPQTAAIT